MRATTGGRETCFNTYHIKIMFHLDAFCYIPNKNIAIMACRKHNLGIKWVRFQNKYFISMTLFEHRSRCKNNITVLKGDGILIEMTVCSIQHCETHENNLTNLYTLHQGCQPNSLRARTEPSRVLFWPVSERACSA